jgi:predicted DNA-binding transcriptional regulator AlpA
VSSAKEASEPYDPLLTADQLSLWLGKPKSTLYAWRTRGVGPRGTKVGNSLGYRRSDVEAYLDANTAPTPSDSGRNRLAR